MEEYIKKSALVEWVKKEDKEIQPNKDWHFDEYTEGYVDALAKILSFIDTFEVKDIDLDDKIYDYINAHYSEGCDGGMISDAHNDIGGVTCSDLTSLAKHFFELGMQVSNKSQKGENV